MCACVYVCLYCIYVCIKFKSSRTNGLFMSSFFMSSRESLLSVIGYACLNSARIVCSLVWLVILWVDSNKEKPIFRAGCCSCVVVQRQLQRCYQHWLSSKSQEGLLEKYLPGTEGSCSFNEREEEIFHTWRGPTNFPLQYWPHVEHKHLKCTSQWYVVYAFSSVFFLISYHCSKILMHQKQWCH